MGAASDELTSSRGLSVFNRDQIIGGAKWDGHHLKYFCTYFLQNASRHERMSHHWRVCRMHTWVWDYKLDMTKQININNPVWFRMKGVNKCPHVHLASWTDGFTAGQLLSRKCFTITGTQKTTFILSGPGVVQGDGSAQKMMQCKAAQRPAAGWTSPQPSPWPKQKYSTVKLL